MDTSIDLEALRARLAIRDFFLDNLFREVYENIGQVLSLSRILLARTDSVEKASELIGNSIRDLRELCRNFYPDAEILKEKGFVNFTAKATKIIFPGAMMSVHADEEIVPERKWIVFNMMLGLLNSIKELKGEMTDLTINFTQNFIDLVITYKGATIRLEAFYQRADLINATFDLKNANGITHLKLLTPLN